VRLVIIQIPARTAQLPSQVVTPTINATSTMQSDVQTVMKRRVSASVASPY